MAELLRRHSRLLATQPALATQSIYVGSSVGTLTQLTVRFRSDYPDIEPFLQNVFLDLFRLGSEFEVVVTFNAILSNKDGDSFSVFYGHDYRAGNAFGASERLTESDRTYVIRSPSEVSAIPTSFDFESLLAAHRHRFDDSNVKIVRFINVVYLIYQLNDAPEHRTLSVVDSRRRQQRRQQQQQPGGSRKRQRRRDPQSTGGGSGFASAAAAADDDDDDVNKPVAKKN
jgi:hypothetical protein